MVWRSILIGQNDGRGGGAAVDYHREPLADPLRRGDPHDRCGTLDLDDPELKLR